MQPPQPPQPPTGTVTFLFTDIEGSTQRWEAHPQQMRAALQQHDAVLWKAIEGNEGHVFKTLGDAFYAAFPTPLSALAAALDAQRSLLAEQWDPDIGSLPVRMALHTGIAETRDGDYYGQPLNRVARLLSAGHGGQVLLAEVTYGLIRDSLPDGIAALDLGEQRLKDLYRPEHVFQVVAPDLPSEFPPLRTLENHPNNLPIQATPFIGRQKELASLLTILRRTDARLVALTGAGGVGKTRMALQAGAEMLNEFQDGVFAVELAPLTDHSLVPSAIGQALGVVESAGKTIMEALKDYLRDKHLLLILDNFEQVSQAAPVVDVLMKSAPRLKVLVTSRMPLNLYGEHDFPVPPLELPDIREGHLPPLDRLTQYDAVRLFIERAQAARPDFQVTNDSAPAVAEICVRLDGLPLAIELAAARVRLFTPQALLSRLSSRLKLLTGGAANLPRRQQTLRATIEWSYDLLNEGEQQLFRRMAVFNGGRTFEALEAVCNCDGQLKIDLLDGAESLVNKSLLQQREGSDGEPRLWMLETIHEYAREKLEESGKAEEMQRQHARYFAALAEKAAKSAYGPDDAAWLHRLEEEHENLRAALDWAASADRVVGDRERTILGLKTAANVRRFWSLRGYMTEGRAWIGRALAAAQCFSADQAGDAERDGGDADLEILTAWVSLNAGSLAWLQRDHADARNLAERALAVGRARGEKRLLNEALNLLGSIAMWEGDHHLAAQMLTENLALARELGHEFAITRGLHSLGISVQYIGDWVYGDALLKEALARYREAGSRLMVAYVLVHLANGALAQGDPAGAREQYLDSLPVLAEFQDGRVISEALEGLACADQADPDGRAARLFGAAEAVRQSAGVKLAAFYTERQAAAVEATKARWGEEAYSRGWQEGRAMSMEEAIEYALGGTAAS